MYLSGSFGNAFLHSSLQKPITTPLCSRVIPATTSKSFRGHLALNAFLAAAGSLNSATLPMNFAGSASNLPLQLSQQKAISWVLYVEVLEGSMSLPESGHFALMGFAAATA